MERVQQGTSLGWNRMVLVLVVIADRRDAGRPWVHCCLDVTHATPSTRQKFAHTDRHPNEPGSPPAGGGRRWRFGAGAPAFGVLQDSEPARRAPTAASKRRRARTAVAIRAHRAESLSRDSRALGTSERCASAPKIRAVQERCASKYPGLSRHILSQRCCIRCDDVGSLRGGRRARR